MLEDMEAVCSALFDECVLTANYMLSGEYVHPSSVRQAALWLRQVHLSPNQQERVQALEEDAAVMAQKKQPAAIPTEERFPVPAYCDSDYLRLVWIGAQLIINLFKAGDYAGGYLFLMEFSFIDLPVYTYALSGLRTHLSGSEKTELGRWAALHALFAADVCETTCFETGGMKVLIETN